MTCTIREYTKSKRVGFEVDIRFEWPDGTAFRRRYRAPVATKTEAKAWGRRREVEILAAGRDGNLARSKREKPDPASQEKEVPTLETFAPRFVDGYARAEKQKASTVATKERILRLHLLPLLGSKRLDQITNEDIAKLKGSLGARKRKTVNNIVNVLSKLLNVAVEWGVIPVRSCTIKLLKVDHPTPKFYEFDEYDRLVAAAKELGPRIYLTVLLGGRAGLRRGEIMAARWCDVDFKRRHIAVEKSVWEGIEDVPKGGRSRQVDLTDELLSALESHRHKKSKRVLCHDDGIDVDENTLQDWIEQATTRAGLEPTRSLHILRHTFCSHLAMRGASTVSIQKLAGHESIEVTMRYMHLSPSAKRDAIELLNDGRRGETLEKVAAQEMN